MKMISENPQISIDEMRITLDVTDRTIARYIWIKGLQGHRANRTRQCGLVESVTVEIMYR